MGVHLVRASTRSPMQALGQLTDRDRIILGWLYDHQIMTTDQIATALFPSLDTAQERLRTLYQIGLLDRGRMYREGGGKHSWRYMLNHDGWTIIAAVRGDGPPPRRDKLARRNLNLVQSPKTPHLLGVNSFFTGLAGYARHHDGAELEQWLSETQVANSMGVVLSPGPHIRPDGLGVFTEHGRSVTFFYEYDTGTEFSGGRGLSRSPDLCVCAAQRLMCERYRVQHLWCKDSVRRVVACSGVGVGLGVGFGVGLLVRLETDTETDLPDQLKPQLGADTRDAVGCPERPSGSSPVGGDDVCVSVAIGFFGSRLSSPIGTRSCWIGCSITRC